MRLHPTVRAVGIALWLALATSAGAATFTTNVTISFYCNSCTNCRICCGRWAPANRTASGVRPQRYVTAACNWLPFGTRIHLPGFGSRVVQDRMASAYSDRIDVFVGHDRHAHKRALRLGVRRLTVTVETKP